MRYSPNKPEFSPRRRQLLALPALALFAGCNWQPGDATESFLKKFQSLNDWMQAAVFNPNTLAKEYEDAELTAEEHFRVNDYDTDEPDIDIPNWSLTVEGLCSKPGDYNLQQISALPKVVKNLRHCCVEGWSMIPKWGGVRMRDFLEMIGADPNAKYIKVDCGDDYFTSWDMPSAMHAQTLLAYEAYGKPLALQHGAPLRVVMPVKLGYKSAKWISKLTITNDRPGGYWEDQGYDWFAGT